MKIRKFSYRLLIYSLFLSLSVTAVPMYAVNPGTANTKITVLGRESKSRKNEISGLGWGATASPNYNFLLYERQLPSKKYQLMLNGKVVGTYEEIHEKYVFDKGNYIALVKEKGNQSIIADRNKVLFAAKPGEKILDLTVTKDGTHIVYAVQRGERTYVVKDGIEVASYTETWPIDLTHINMSADGQRIAYFIPVNKSEWSVVVDGNQWTYANKGTAGLNSAPWPIFSPDGKHVLYHATSFDSGTFKVSYHIILNGKEVDTQGYKIESARFAPDNQVLYAAIDPNDGASVVIKGSQELRRKVFPSNERGFESPVVSADEKSLAVIHLANHLYPPSYWSREYVMDIDGLEKGYYANVNSAVFSPDSNHVVFTADGHDLLTRVIIDGQEVEERYNNIFQPFFTPDSSKIVFIARKGSQWLRIEKSL